VIGGITGGGAPHTGGGMLGTLVTRAAIADIAAMAAKKMMGR
jgi:hypothetical protein